MILAILGLSGCGDSLLGPWEIEQRIASPPLPDDPVWEVRWVGSEGLRVACERIDAGTPEGGIAVLGSAELPLPSLPPPPFVDAGTYRWALALPVLTDRQGAFPPTGDASLDDDLGVWGTSAPLGWLQVEGDLDAAGAALMLDGSAAPQAGWVDVVSELAWTSGRIDGALERLEVPPTSLYATALFWTDDEDWVLWSGEGLGGITSTCEGP
ncbi:MAG: hypothetical protein R3F61_12620 [Myxococcota bacterium]